MRRSLDVYLWEVRNHAQGILEMTADRTFESYAADELLRLAIERKFTVLGEALVRVRLHFPLDFDKIIDSTNVVRFRNRLVHLYDLMKDDEVWRVITSVLPAMIVQVTSMIDELQP